MKKKEIYQAPAVEVIELKEKIYLQAGSPVDPTGTGNDWSSWN